MNRQWSMVVAAVLVTLLPGAVAARADDAAPTPAATADAKAEFARQFQAYKDAFRQVERLRADYQTADASTRAKINAELTGRLAAMQKTVDAMVAAAADIYRAAPNADPAMTNLLLAVARYDAAGLKLSPPAQGAAGGDRYEHAMPIIKLLIDGGAQEPLLPVWGLVSAVATNDYDLAGKYLAMLEKSGALVDQSLYEGPAEQSLHRLAISYASVLDEEREKWEKESAIRAAETQADNLPQVRLATSKGDITVELFEDQAPDTVANFITLVKQGFYDGLTFHRVIGKFMAQAGDPAGDGTGGPGYTIRDECHEPDARMHFRGSLSMAHTEAPDSGGSQFFITFVPTPHLDGMHTVFGRVIDGMDVLAEIQRREPNGKPDHDAMLPPPDRILKAEVLRDRGHEYTFERLPDKR